MSIRSLFVLALAAGCSTSDPPKPEPPAAPVPAKKPAKLHVEPSSDPSQPPSLVLARAGGKGAALEAEDATIYKVVMNAEEQYSIWPANRDNALGWNDAGKTGTKVECLAYIEQVWTDMRPLSLRKRLEEPPPFSG